MRMIVAIVPCNSPTLSRRALLLGQTPEQKQAEEIVATHIDKENANEHMTIKRA